MATFKFNFDAYININEYAQLCGITKQRAYAKIKDSGIKKHCVAVKINQADRKPTMHIPKSLLPMDIVKES